MEKYVEPRLKLLPRGNTYLRNIAYSSQVRNVIIWIYFSCISFSIQLRLIRPFQPQ